MRSNMVLRFGVHFCIILLCVILSCQAQPLPEASAEKLPLWHGFNLLDKFYKGNPNTEGPFKEEDFRWISEFGFNFVRLPMDYRQWIVNSDWTQLDEKVLKEIDQAVEYGKQYNIHVCINFHRAPGYTVANPPEAKSLWTDAEAQKICAMHWAAFAKRYQGIPNKNLSFNLLNEPADVDAKTHARVIALLVKAIRAEDPDRLILIDGLNWGANPCPELATLKIAQATRGYQPFQLTHYKAEWVNSAGWPEPQWPQVQGLGGFLYSPGKKELQSPISIDADLPEPMTLRIHVGIVSASGKLVVSIDGKAAFEEVFTPGPGDGPWKKSEYKAQWKIYQNLYDRDYSLSIPAGKHTIQIDNTEGDWMTITEIAFTNPAKREYSIAAAGQWGQKNYPLRFNPASPGPFSSGKQIDGRWLWNEYVVKWRDFRDAGVGVMVGEWGAYNHTPHETTLRWMEDCLINYRDARLGWALWNFRGSFGVLDSERNDVQYEDFHGHKLDRKMLNLLIKYK